MTVKRRMISKRTLNMTCVWMRVCDVVGDASEVPCEMKGGVNVCDVCGVLINMLVKN